MTIIRSLFVGLLFMAPSITQALELTVVRHGETAWNQVDRFQGHEDIPLSDSGRAQALALREILAETEFDAAYASDLARARQTAELLDKGAVRTDPRLRELAMGEFEGQYRHEMDMEEFQRLIRRPGLDPERGVETLDAFEVRIKAAFDELVARHRNDKRILIVAHGGVLRMILERIVSNDAELPIRYSNCQFITLEVNDSGGRSLGMGGLEAQPKAKAEGGAHLG